MKAVLDHDRIVHISETGTEIGAIPKGVGLERLRFDGRNVVDLAGLTEIWVEPKGAGFYELHAVETPHSQRVKMTYADRKRLVMDDGVIRVKTREEELDEQMAEKLRMLKNRRRVKILKNIGDPEDRLADAYKLIYAILLLILTDNPVIRKLFDDLVPIIANTYSTERLQVVINRSAGLQDLMTEYYIDVEKITGNKET